MLNENKLEISLIIDENNSLKFDFEIDKLNDNNILNLCNNISKKYNINEQIKIKLYKHLLNEIQKIKNIIEKDKNNKNNSKIKNNNNNNEVFIKLYNQGMNKKKQKEIESENAKKEILKQEMKNLTFSPKINNYYNKKNNINNISIVNKNKNINESNFNSNENKNENYLKLKLDNNNINKKIEYKTIINSNRNSKNKLNIFKDFNIKNNKNKINSFRNANKNNNNFSSKKTIKNKEKLSLNSSINSSEKNNNNNKNIKIFHTLENKKNEFLNRLYNKQKISKIKQKKLINEYFSEYYPFTPKISNGSKILTSQRNESSEQFYKRLSSSKKILNKNNNKISKSNKNLKIKNINLKSNSNSKEKPYLKESNKIIIKSEKNIENEIKEIEKNNEIKQKIYKNKVNSNIENFKLNEIKLIYNILCKDENKLNFQALNENNIPKHIIERVIKPTCLMINNKNLEFNFQNFYLICKEFLDKFF